MKWKVFVITAVAVLGVSGALAYKFAMPAPSTSLVQEASAAEVLEFIKSQSSPLVLVNFWASWCEPCKIEFPHILAVRQKYEAQGLRVVFVSLDDVADLGAAESFLREQKVDFSTFYKGKQPLKFVSEIYPKWSGAIPTTLLFGGDHKIVEAWEGDTSLEEFEARIQRHLKGT